jgi:DNA repair exonuclease SbcCD ATPase subunit
LKLVSLTLQNFGSYKNLDFRLDSQGLTLIHGTTGAGKSTIPDAACWVLFGETARGGAVDEVRSWQHQDEPTRGDLLLETPKGQLVVVRIRGKAKENDLYWYESDETETIQRGKDLNDTQAKLNQRLGMDIDSYTSGAYFHEFSASGSFFTAKAKDRRGIFERIAELVLPARIAESSTNHRKSVKEQISSLQTQYDRLDGKLQQLNLSRDLSTQGKEKWEETQVKKIKEAEEKVAAFDEARVQSIKQLRDSLHNPGELEELIPVLEARIAEEKKKRCSECGGPKKSADYEELQSLLSDLNIKRRENVYTNSEIERRKREKNPYIDQLVRLQSEKNPFIGHTDNLISDIAKASQELSDTSTKLKVLEHRFDGLLRIYDLAGDLRGELLKRTVKNIEAETNRYLETYFDSEIKVQFEVDGDNLQVAIQKSGYEASYKQLSRGQRSLLRLCFCVTTMEATSSRCGVHFDNLFFDEVLDGLSDELKVKAFGLFSELETKHDSVFLIDHAPSFQELFTKRYSVSLVGDESIVSSDKP